MHGRHAASNSRCCRTRFVGSGSLPTDDRRGVVQGFATVSELASGQLGLVTYEQLRHARCTRATVRGLIAGGALTAVYRHVYVVSGRAGIVRTDRPRGGPGCGQARVHVAHDCSAAQEPAASGTGRPGSHDDATSAALRVAGDANTPQWSADGSDTCMLGSVLASSVERVIVDLSSRLSNRDLGLLIDDALRRRLTTCRSHSQCGGTACPGTGPKSDEGRKGARRAHAIAETESVLEDFVCDGDRVASRFRRPFHNTRSS